MRSVLSFFEYFVVGFSRHLTLVCVLLLLGAIVFARFGRSFGIDRLFWHESSPLQFRAGVASALLFAKVGFVGYLLDAQGLEPLGSFSGPHPADRVLGAARYLALLSLPVGLCWTLLGTFAARARRAPLLVPRTWFVLGAAGGLLGSVGLLVAFARLAPSTPAVPRWLVALLFLERVPEPLRPLHVLAAIFVLALSAEYLVYAVARESFTPAMAICTLLGLVTGVTGFLEFRAWNQSALVLAFLGAVALGGLPRYKVRLDALRERYRAPVPLQTATRRNAHVYPLVRSELIPWRTREGEKRPLVLVCASGGGLRAALWTVEVLSELEQELPEFAGAIRIVAGASGGMVGASAYVLTLLSPEERGPGWAHRLTRGELIARLGADSLSATIKRLVFRDLLFAGLPVHNLKSRGEALESCWQAHMGGAFDARFGDLVDRECRGELPSLVFSPMLVEDGRRLLISNLELDFIAENRAPVDGRALPLSRSGFELARLFPEDFAAFPVRTAARLSAAFPYVSPAVSLPTAPRRRVVDAGYYDNYGVNVCAAWLSDCFCSEERRRWIEDNVARVLIVQVRDQRSPLHGTNRDLQERSGALSRGFESISTPVQGVLSSRDSVSVFRNDEQLEQAIRLYDGSLGRGFLRTEIFEYPGEASLSWYLTQAEREAISHEARKLGAQLEELRAFWEGRPKATARQVGVHIADAEYGWGER